MFDFLLDRFNEHLLSDLELRIKHSFHAVDKPRPKSGTEGTASSRIVLVDQIPGTLIEVKGEHDSYLIQVEGRGAYLWCGDVCYQAPIRALGSWQPTRPTPPDAFPSIYTPRINGIGETVVIPDQEVRFTRGVLSTGSTGILPENFTGYVPSVGEHPLEVVSEPYQTLTVIQPHTHWAIHDTNPRAISPPTFIARYFPHLGQ